MLRNVRLLIKCRVCEVLVTNLNQHMLQRHPAAPVTREQLEQLGQSRRVGPSEGTTADSGRIAERFLLFFGLVRNCEQSNWFNNTNPKTS